MAFDIEAAKQAGYTDAEIQQYLSTQPGNPATGKVPEVREAVPAGTPSTLEDIGRSVGPEFTRGVVGLLTAPHSISSLVEQGLGADPAAGRTGVPMWPSYNEAISKVEQHYPGNFYKPETTGGKYVGTAAQNLLPAMLGGGGWAPKLLQWAGSSIGSEAAGQALEGEGGLETAGRVGGSLLGATPAGIVRKLVTPNPYNPKAYANFKAQEADVAANTMMTENPNYTKTIAALRTGTNPVDVGKYFKDSFDQLTPAQQAAAKRAGNPRAKPYTGPGNPPPAPSPSYTGDQYALMVEALRRDIANAGPGERQSLIRLNNTLEKTMDKSLAGKPYEGAWGDLRAQRNALDEGVEKRIASGGMLGKAGASALGAVTGAAAAAKMGLAPGVMEALMTGGAGMLAGLGGHTVTKGLTSKIVDNVIPGMAAYRRNQVWQPSELTRVNKAQQARMLAGGDLILPPLVNDQQQ